MSNKNRKQRVTSHKINNLKKWGFLNELNKFIFWFIAIFGYAY